MGVFINTDAMTFFNSLLSEMNEAGLERDVDFYTAKGGVEAVLFNMNFQRCYWRSHSREAIWDGVEFHDDGRLFFNGREVVNVDPEPAMKRWIVAAYVDFRAAYRGLRVIEGKRPRNLVGVLMSRKRFLFAVYEQVDLNRYFFGFF